MNDLFEQGHLLGQEELEKLDKMVSDYLLFRSFKQTQQQLFLDKRHSLHANGPESARHQRATIQRILNALDNGDYPQLVTLWDSFITQKIGTVKSSLLAMEAREAEFLANLCGAIYPLRPEIIQIAGDPALAAKVAARAMTIFKHYLETRGARLVEFKDLEFYPYRNLFKIAFPPAHPQFKHLFTDAWSRTARERIVKFMEKFFTPSDLPVLCTLYERLNTKAETELKEIFRRRERKLLKFSRSLYALANDLLSGLESGKPVDKAFLTSFRNRFNTFGEIIRPDNDFDEEMGSLGSPEQEISGLSISKSSPTNKNGASSPGPGSSNRQHFSPSRPNARSKLVHKVADLGHLDYASMARDIAFMAGDVGTELGGLVTRDYLLSLADAAVKSQVAMQGCVLLQALVEYISRPDKEIQTQSARTSAVTALCRVDILGLRSATTQHSFVDISSGSIGLESRSITRLLFSLAEAMKKIPEPSTPRGDLLMESSAKTPPYERLLLAGQVIAEYSCRLILALSTATPGVSYLHTFGVRLTAALADFLVSLPLSEDFDSGGDDDLDIYGHPSSSSSSVTKRGGGAIRTWCLMALSVLTGQSKTNQLVVIKRGGVSWLTRTLGMYISEVLQLMRSSPEPCSPSQFSNLSPAEVTEASTGLFEMSISLLNIIVYSAQARRFLVGSLNMQRETESLAGVLLLLIATCGRSEYQSNLIVSTLQILLREVSMRELLRALNETTLLRNSIEQGAAMSVDAAVAKSLLAEIDSNSSSEDDGRGGNDANPEVSDLLEMVSATQVKLPENSLLAEYCSGMTNSGLAFLMRYTSSAGRIFVGEEQQYHQNDGRLHSPPIHANRFSDDTSPGAHDTKGQPKLKPSLPRTPPRLDQGANPRYISHGREIVEGEGGDDEQDDGGLKKGKKAKSKKNQDDDEEEEEDEEEDEEEEEKEVDKDDEGDGGGEEDEDDD